MCAQPKPERGTSVPLGFGDVVATVGDHIAHFYRGADQMFSILAPYVAEGIRRTELCVVISSPAVTVELKKWLQSVGVDAGKALKSGQLIFHSGEATSAAMRELADRVLTDASKAGYEFVRWSGDGGWALAGKISVHDMLCWEALYDKFSVNWDIIALCQFDLTLFGGDVVMDALRSHPFCIIGQNLISNPFHISPEVLLQELSERA